MEHLRGNTMEVVKQDPMKKKHLCVCCYLKGEEPFMLDARDFGINAASDFHEKYITQGQWTRCLYCMQEVAKNTNHVTHPAQTSNTGFE